jgi:hypothetical protein
MVHDEMMHYVCDMRARRIAHNEREREGGRERERERERQIGGGGGGVQAMIWLYSSGLVLDAGQTRHTKRGRGEGGRMQATIEGIFK